MTADAVVVGSGPNGLAAAVTLARAGLKVRVVEGADTLGGGARTLELIEPGHWHDVCSSVHPMVAASPFLRTLDLEGRGIRLLEPDVQYAQPLDGGRGAHAYRSLERTAVELGPDGAAWTRMFEPLARHWPGVVGAVLAPLRRVPRSPFAAGRFGLLALRGAYGLATSRFETPAARALFAGAAAHAMMRLEDRPTAALGGLLGLLAHGVGWPLVEGGSQRIVDGLVAELTDLGGETVTGTWVRSLEELRPARVVLLDVAPRAFLELAGSALPDGYARQLRRFRYGPGVCKVDWILSEPVPWTDPIARRAGTLHLGGTIEELARSERDAVEGRHSDRPYVLTVQPTVVDPTRAPAGRHLLWAYCHVPSGSTVDMTERIEAQIERFAPGFRDTVVARVVKTAARHDEMDPNYVGGDISCGVQDIWQTVFRPAVRWDPYRTPLPGVWLCSSATPPGSAVHGMCGYWAARSALRELNLAAPALAKG